jgi:hypothetical protein
MGSQLWFSEPAVVQVPASFADDLASKIPAPVVNIASPETNSSVDTEILAKLNADDNWKADAEALALTDLTENSNKHLYNYMLDLELSIDVKGDINSVVVKDSDVTGADKDNKDAIVVQKLKVYYEDLSGDDVKTYITVTTTIVDGEVDNVTSVLTV